MELYLGKMWKPLEAGLTNWKCSNVVPIYKSGERSDPNNYRPISLLSITSKVMESIINDYVKKHLWF